jgi:signal transduction histidine kinase
VVSAFALTAALVRAHQGLDEAAEVPMMGGLFLAMVWYATRWKAATDELARSHARERDFVRDASHQLRTPITIARGHAELARDTLATQASVSADVDVILGELDRLSRISNRLLAVARAEQAVPGLSVPVDVALLAREAVQRWRSTAARAWRLSASAQGAVMGDPGRIADALDALIENAVKATRPGDRIAVEVRGEAGAAVIEVADSGRGIAPEDQERVFERFWRGVDYDGTGGTGLGLAIVKSTAEAHGGSADVSSNGAGGATFRIRLPGLMPNVSPVKATDSPNISQVTSTDSRPLPASAALSGDA